MNQLAFCTLVIVVVLEPSLASAQDAPFVRDVFGRINAQRTQHRLTALTYDTTLEKAAQAHAEWMARNRTMEHLQAPPGNPHSPLPGDGNRRRLHARRQRHVLVRSVWPADQMIVSRSA